MNMKKAIFWLIIAPFHLFSQVSKDSVWQVSDAGAFFSVRLVEYANGESSLTKTRIGDTATVFSFDLQRAESEANRLANVAFEARNFDRQIRNILQRRDTVLATLGLDMTDTLAKKYAAPLLASGWKVLEGQAETDIVFSISAQGQLRYEITGFQPRNAFILGRAMRLNNYKDGNRLDVYNAPGGNWFSIDNAVRLRFPGNLALDRSAAKPPVSRSAEMPAVQEKPKTEKAVKKKKKQ